MDYDYSYSYSTSSLTSEQAAGLAVGMIIFIVVMR